MTNVYYRSNLSQSLLAPKNKATTKMPNFRLQNKWVTSPWLRPHKINKFIHNIPFNAVAGLSSFLPYASRENMIVVQPPKQKSAAHAAAASGAS